MTYKIIKSEKLLASLEAKDFISRTGKYTVRERIKQPQFLYRKRLFEVSRIPIQGFGNKIVLYELCM